MASHLRLLCRAVALTALLAAVSVVRADLTTQALATIRTADLRQTQYSIMARNLVTGEELVRVNADDALAPASNMKILTTAAALYHLGPDFMFQTEVRLLPAAGSQADPTLVVIGDGDPSLGDPRLLQQHGMDVEDLIQSWAKAVADTGVKRLAAIVMDDRVFDDVAVHPSWPVDQLHQWYCAQVSGINFHDNCLDVYPTPTFSRQAPRLRISPAVPFLPVSNRGTTGPSDSFWVSREPGTNALTFRGTVKTERVKPVSVTIDGPALLLGQILEDRLKSSGITVGAVRRAAATEQWPAGRPIHRVQAALPVVIARCNKDSQNLFAEALFKRIGHKLTGAPGSWDNGAAALRLFLQEKLGARSAGVVVADGSGLSRDNRISARLMVDLLAAVWADPALRPGFVPSLSVGGEDGTLQLRMRQGVSSTVYGKSGYIEGVSALSGYLVLQPQGGSDGPAAGTPSPQVIAFSFLFNGFKPPVYNHTLKQVQDRLVRLLDQTMDEPAPAIGG